MFVHQIRYVPKMLRVSRMRERASLTMVVKAICCADLSIVVRGEEMKNVAREKVFFIFIFTINFSVK